MAEQNDLHGNKASKNAQNKRADLTGQVFGKLTVLYHTADYIQPSGQHKQMVHCICECGKECDVRVSDIKSGNTKSCGCFQEYSRGKNQFVDLTGKRYGKLLVMYRQPNRVTPSGQNIRMWHCKCDCGNECDVYATRLKGGQSSCGCLSQEKRANRAKERKQLQVDYLKLKADKRKENNHLLSDERFQALIAKDAKKEAVKLQKDQKRVDYLKKNSLEHKCPELCKEWNYSKNRDLRDGFGRDISIPGQAPFSSNIKAWWKCKKGHEWEAVISSRSHGSGCPYCSNQKVLDGYNDLKTWCLNKDRTDLLDEWDSDKNTLRPEQDMPGTREKVWWKCSLGHSFDASIASRTGKQKVGCPYCSNPPKRILKGFNDFASKYPELSKEWHPYKNGNLNPDEVFSGSAKKVWWLGKCGHEFEQKIVNRVYGANCPYCSHQKLLVGFNDLATTNPKILEEWDYDKNTLLPTEIGVGTHNKVWWKCPFGHSYQAYPSNRCGITHSGCPICDKENHTSFPEQALFYYIKSYFPDAINSDRSTIGLELDVYIPSIRIAIEYDGKAWHQNNKTELKKNLACKEKNILLMRIREEGLVLYDDCYCIVRNDIKRNDSLSDVIKRVLLDIDNDLKIDVDVERDAAIIYSSYITTRKEHSLKAKYPEVASEWHPTKNGLLSPDMVAPNTNKRVWWLGKCGHEWPSTVASRANMRCGCPICSGKRVISGINDLLTAYPELCEEWDYEKNNIRNIFPDKVSPHSDKKAWWKCGVCGFCWPAKIDGRTRMKAGCPRCAKSKISKSKSKPVRCIETRVEYESAVQAEQQTGISRSSIGSCCKGKCKTAGKYHWEFVYN